ncbi:hypothetical protein TraAM80_05393 [Trypanosoma rangeli]|uniref:Uncharacterized protein n=1 Tax=Trypanosoma rangeli TaxID=5698 RepID=A0A422NFP0_TRYRA|nr:uncharacterized protein TraAM80_05393 [Trypanosoma rangeli]RNF04257.1 hypothetical protein TraAM80_05393 [Trypanosoma rangeli]|eukprot:RNF04257.1 hypothetical protein TraAM80_05393 [Trypanosoma rangeli]
MVMYDPAAANNYRDFKVMRWKRAREEEQKNDISRSLAAAAGMGPSPFEMPEMMSTTARDEFAYGILGGGGDTMQFHLSAEELHQRRVRQSAALGITTAMKLERDELEAAHKARVAAGMDRKGRIGQKLGKLMSAAATKGNTTDTNAIADSAGTGKSTSGGDTTPAPGTSTPTSTMLLAGSSAQLVFQRSELAAGGYVVREDVGTLDKRRMHRGKPSSTILIRFVRDGPPVEMFDDTANGDSDNTAMRNAFLENIQCLCGQCGVVRSVRYVVLSDAEKVSLRARLEKEDVTAASAGVETRLAREMVRVLVRFDTVANGFKALEMLQQRHGSNWDVCFFSTQLFDAGALGPAEGEALCCS